MDYIEPHSSEICYSSKNKRIKTDHMDIEKLKKEQLLLDNDNEISTYNDDIAPMKKLKQSEISELPESLPPEIEEGNIEYKLQLLNPTKYRFQQLVTQMKWRLEEGEGEAFYEIGVADNGTLTGLVEKDLNTSLNTLGNMAKQLGATPTIVRHRYISESEIMPESPMKEAVEVLVRRIPEDRQFIDVRLVVLGNAEVGKSTLLGVLTYSQLDNGRGRSRLNLFRYLHEIQSGRTSSISHEVIGYDHAGKIVNYSENRTAEHIYEQSSKLVTLIDLCGEHRYLKTTVSGLTGCSPDYGLLMVSAISGMAGTTREHLGYALALAVPVFVAVTKVDSATTKQLQRTLKSLQRTLAGPGCNKIPYLVDDEDKVFTAASNIQSKSICPIFTISSVTGQGINLLHKFLNLLPPVSSKSELGICSQQLAEHQIDAVYNIPGVGVVAGGTVLRGSIKPGDRMMIGPGYDGGFKSVEIGSLHRNRVPCRLILAGQSASISFNHLQSFVVRKGMVLLAPEAHPQACYDFEAEVYLLYHAKTLQTGYQCIVHVGSVRQSVSIEHMSRRELKTNEKARIGFRFKHRPEYVKIGARMLFREGNTKGMGVVCAIIPWKSSVLENLTDYKPEVKPDSPIR